MKIFFVNTCAIVLIWIGFNYYLESKRISSSVDYNFEVIKKTTSYELIRQKAEYSGNSIYSYQYRREPFGKFKIRVPINKRTVPEKIDLQIVLLGGSFVDGDGLDDESTIWSLLNEKLKDNSKVSVVKLSHRGWSFANFYQLLITENPIFKTILKNTPTVFIYLLPNFHEQRVIPTIQDLLMNPDKLKEFPFFTKVAPGEYSYKGDFSEVIPNFFSISSFLTNSYLLTPSSYSFIKKLFGIDDIPLSIAEKDLNTPFELLDNFALELKKHFQIDEFLVIPYPFNEMRSMASYSPKYFEYLLAPPKELFNSIGMKDLFYEYEGHPKRKLNEILSGHIYQLLLDRNILKPSLLSPK